MYITNAQWQFNCNALHVFFPRSFWIFTEKWLVLLVIGDSVNTILSPHLIPWISLCIRKHLVNAFQSIVFQLFFKNHPKPMLYWLSDEWIVTFSPLFNEMIIWFIQEVKNHRYRTLSTNFPSKKISPNKNAKTSSFLYPIGCE